MQGTRSVVRVSDGCSRYDAGMRSVSRSTDGRVLNAIAECVNVVCAPPAAVMPSVVRLLHSCVCARCRTTCSYGMP
jgi:hypothetical protein